MLDALALSYALHLAPKGEPAELQCLAEAVYYEAKTQTVQGQLAVAQVVLNRRKSPAFPQSICAVVYQKKDNRCQFSWACNAKTLRQARDPLQWAVAREVARFALIGNHTGHHLIQKCPVVAHQKHGARIVLQQLF